jgi:hypothetical protein
VIAIIAGLVVLLGYFLELPLLEDLRQVFLRWFVVLAAVALLVGVVNLALVHLGKASGGQKGSLYSLALLISLAATLGLGLLFGPTSGWSQWIFNYIQVPIESSLMAVLAAVLIFAAARLLQRRLNLFSIIFLAAALIVLLGTAPILGVEFPWLHGQNGLRAWFQGLLAVAGARGLLLGIALGTIAAGLRVLMGADRPYGGG